MSSASGKFFWKVTRWARAVRFWLFLALACLAWLGLGGEARAQDYSACTDVTLWNNNALCPSREAALNAARMIAEFKNQAPDTHPTVCSGPVNWSGGRRYYTCTFREAVTRSVARHYLDECPPGEVWNDDTQQCSVTCANRPPLVDRAMRGALVICHDGCSYSATTSPDSFSFSFGNYNAGEEWSPTGQECGIEDTSEDWNPEQETCRTIPGASFNECIRPDGSHCVTGSKGTRMCWQPGEAGERMATSGEEGASKGPANSDPDPPNGMEDPLKVGETTTTINGDTTTTNVFEGGGNSGGQGNTGTGGSEDAGEGEDGSVSGGGSCDAPPICSGDAVMCAINEGTWRARCAGAEGGDDAVGDFNDALADGDEDADLSGLEDAADPSNWREIEDMGDHVLDESGFAGGGNCPVLPSFSVGPSSVSISLTPLCDLLVSLSSLVMGLAYFMGFKIIAGVK